MAVRQFFKPSADAAIRIFQASPYGLVHLGYLELIDLNLTDLNLTGLNLTTVVRSRVLAYLGGWQHFESLDECNNPGSESASPAMNASSSDWVIS
jgi:hypothetical protein